MTLVLRNHTFRTNVNLIVFAKIFGFLLGMLQAELVDEALVGFNLPLLDIASAHLLLTDLAVNLWANSTVSVQFLLVVDVV